MPRNTTSLIRNVALTGHNGSGKTTLVEQILFRAGLIHGRIGTVEEGTTVSDFEQEEKDHKHSLYAKVVSFDHEDRHFNLFDTPGFPDFMGQTLSVFPAVETVAVVIGADRGIQTTTRRAMAIAKERRLPRMIIVNKIDEHVGELEELLDQIRDTFGPECLPINLPTPDGSDVIDLWEHSDGKAAFSSVAEGHTRIIDQVVEIDEDLMAVYLETKSLSMDQLHDAFEKSLRESHLVPVCFCSAKTGAGLDALMHTMANLCPSPEEGNPRPFLLQEKEGEPERDWFPKPDAHAELVGHVFKVTVDQFVGKLALVRIHQGTLRAGDQVYVNDGSKAIRLTHIHKVSGKTHTEVPTAIPGDIIAITKHDEIHFNDVLHATPKLAKLHFKSIAMPRPMYGLAIEAKSHADEAKISTAMHKLCEEDPTFRVERISATKQTVAKAMGELHMRVLLERLHNRYRLDLNTQPPKVAYKETISAKAEGHHRHKKQTGGAGQFGEVFLRVEPLNGDAQADLEFVDATVGGSIPRQFLPAIEKGVRQAMVDGAVAGYPVSGVRVEVYDGKYHPVDSKEVAFVSAGKRAFIDAVKKARPVILEPVVDLEITAPANAMGAIASDLSGKRGQVLDTQMISGDMVMIRAKAPLSEMNSYSAQIKSMTGGQGAYVMDYSHDERTPPNVQADIVAAFKPHAEDED